MNNNNTSNIQEPKICIQCMTFYANPKLGDWCSKCFHDRQSLNPQPVKETKPQTQSKIVEPPKSETKSIKETELESKPEIIEKPIQVRTQELFYVF